jgi:hypothetical protein
MIINIIMEEYIKKFNFYVNEFLEQMIYITDDSDLELYRNFYNNFVKLNMNKHVPIDIFCKEIILSKTDENDKNYADYIKERDEIKFLEINIKKENKQRGGNDVSLSKIFEYRKLWMTFDEENKEIIFEYLNQLIDLAENYLKLKYANKL